MTGPELVGLLRSDSMLWVDQCGDLLFQDEVPAGGEVGHLEGVTSADGGVFATGIAPSEVFSLHSRPGAKRVIYLDFDGHYISGSVWNNYWSVGPWQAAPFDRDGSPGSFSDSERAVIAGVWQLVAQDFAPFDVDITTEDPGPAALARESSTDEYYGSRALISSDPIESRCNCAGTSYINKYDLTSNSYYGPSWIFTRYLGDAAGIADTVSHEVGHFLGLRHDGTSTTGYHPGQGGWGPIMGSPWGQAVTQWNSGTYPDANNTQDDVAIIASKGPALLADDAGNTPATATALPLNGSVSGLINTRADVDTYAITSPGGQLNADAAPHWPGPNLDLALSLSDATGNVLTHSAPAFTTSDVRGSLSASISATVPAGTYYLTVDGTGNGLAGTPGDTDYGSLGWYTLTTSEGSASPTDPTEPTTPTEPTDPTTPTDPTDPTTPTDPVPSTISGESKTTGKTWVATVTLTGAVGASTSGKWSDGSSASCTIPSGATSCTFSLTKISSRTATVSYTDAAFGALEIAKPASSTSTTKGGGGGKGRNR